MSPYEILLVALGLAMDAFAVSLVASTCLPPSRVAARLSLVSHFAVFQGGMTLLGALAGRAVVGWVAQVDHWIAFALLVAVGVHMIRESGEAEDSRLDFARWSAVLVLSVATSLDALAVGLGLALLDVDVVAPAGVIALVTGGLSTFGVVAGAHLGPRLGRAAPVVGGVVLLLIGVRILVEHLLSGGP